MDNASTQVLENDRLDMLIKNMGGTSEYTRYNGNTIKHYYNEHSKLIASKIIVKKRTVIVAHDDDESIGQITYHYDLSIDDRCRR